MVRFFVAIFLLLSACSAPEGDNTPLVFLTDWRPQAEQGGFYHAAETGLYAEAGLNVDLRSGGPQSDPARLLAAGAVDMAMISNAFQALNLIALEADVVIVMASFQRDPQILMTHTEARAKSLVDLRDKPIFVGDASVGTFWQWLKASQGYSDDQIRKYNYSLAPWMVTKDAAQQGYVTSEPFTAEQAGAEPNVFLLADAGFTGYAAMVGVTREVYETRRAEVEAFVKASQRGWHSYLTDDPTAGNARILKDNPEMTEALLKNARSEMIRRELVMRLGDSAVDVGRMDMRRWRTLLKECAAFDLFAPDLDLEAYITNDLLL